MNSGHASHKQVIKVNSSETRLMLHGLGWNCSYLVTLKAHFLDDSLDEVESEGTTVTVRVMQGKPDLLQILEKS